MFKSLLGLRSKKDRPKSSSSAIAPNSGESSKTPAPDATPSRKSSDDPPPAYSTTAPSPRATPEIVATSEDDPYAFLSSFDTIFLIDDSGSMKGSSWVETEAALRAFLPICTAHDADGIDLYFLNHHSACGPPSYQSHKAAGGYYNFASPEGVHNLFQDFVRPYGATPTGQRLDRILRAYIRGLAAAKDRESVKPINIIVITDGQPTDDPESVIKAAAKRLDEMDALPHQVGIQFFQVGEDERAREALREMDDELVHQGVRDMVDTVTWDGVDGSGRVLSADGILKVVLGAVIRRLDRRRTKVFHYLY